MTTDTPTPAPTLTVREVSRSLDGYDEDAIEQAFGKEYEDLSVRASVRALVFVLQRRAGKKTAEAKKYAMSLTAGAFDNEFAPAVEEPNDENPVTEQGKESSELA